MTISEKWAIIQSRMSIETMRVGWLSCMPSMNILAECLIAGEDHRYKHHYGIDVLSIGRAVRNHLFRGSREGASTIEQQLVRVLTEDYRHCVSRKLTEALLALRLSHYYDKKVMAHIYLHVAYYGTLYPSLETMVEKYGKKLSDELSLQEGAAIVARLKYPEPKEPDQTYVQKIERRTKYILQLRSQYLVQGKLSL